MSRSMVLRAFPLLCRDTVQLHKQLYDSPCIAIVTILRSCSDIWPESVLMLCRDTVQLYKQLYDSGLQYGPAFRLLRNVHIPDFSEAEQIVE